MIIEQRISLDRTQGGEAGSGATVNGKFQLGRRDSKQEIMGVIELETGLYNF